MSWNKIIVGRKCSSLAIHRLTCNVLFMFTEYKTNLTMSSWFSCPSRSSSHNSPTDFSDNRRGCQSKFTLRWAATTFKTKWTRKRASYTGNEKEGPTGRYRSMNRTFQRHLRCWTDSYSYRLISYRDRTESWPMRTPLYDDRLPSWQRKIKSYQLKIESLTLRFNGWRMKSDDWRPPTKSLREQTKRSAPQTNSWRQETETWQRNSLNCKHRRRTEQLYHLQCR